jgi:hypothetical protein
MDALRSHAACGDDTIIFKAHVGIGLLIYLWNIGANSLNHPLFLGNMNARNRSKKIRRRAGA